MKKELKCYTLHGGMPVLLSVEYRYRIFGIRIPIVFIETHTADKAMTTKQLEQAVKAILK